MEFSVVDVPDTISTPVSPVIDALKKNIGKALAIPCGKRDANTVRKALRASLKSRNILNDYNFRTKIDMVPNTLVAWLEPKEKTSPTEETK